MPHPMLGMKPSQSLATTTIMGQQACWMWLCFKRSQHESTMACLSQKPSSGARMLVMLAMSCGFMSPTAMHPGLRATPFQSPSCKYKDGSVFSWQSICPLSDLPWCFSCNLVLWKVSSAQTCENQRLGHAPAEIKPKQPQCPLPSSSDTLYAALTSLVCFREKTKQYTELIKARDSGGIMELLTDIAVEDRVVERVALKAATFGQDVVSGSAAPSTNLKISPDAVGSLYRKWIMPLTKEVEVMYLLRRLEE
eukprot:363901-Chlamydomonas_euryale.AAC.9